MATIVGIIGGIVVGVFLTILGQWWLASRQRRAARLLCEIFTIRIDHIQIAGFLQSAVSLQVEDRLKDLAGSDFTEGLKQSLTANLTPGMVSFTNIRLKNASDRRIDSIHCSVAGYGRLIAYRCKPEPTAGLPIAVDLLPEKNGTVQIPYLNANSTMDLSLVSLDLLWSPNVRVDAADVQVEYLQAGATHDPAEFVYARDGAWGHRLRSGKVYIRKDARP